MDVIFLEADNCAALLTAWAERNAPKIAVYRDGIGSYEFWGAKCFDRGNLVVEVDGENEFNFAVNVEGMDEDAIDALTTSLDDTFGEFTEPEGCEAEYRFVLDIRNMHMSEGWLRFDGVWVDKSI